MRIERWRAAAVLLVVAGALAAVGSFQAMYTATFRVSNGTTGYSSSLWVVVDERDRTPQEPLDDNGWLIIAVAIALVAAAVLVVRGGKFALVGRVLAMGVAGSLAGILMSYLLMVRRLEKITAEGNASRGVEVVLTYEVGVYLLIAAAVVGLVGAVFAQLREKEPEGAGEAEEAVVVHQFMDDDTPPFGMAVIVEPKGE